MLYLYAKAVHIIFVITWMAGLFYMVRLFIYHTEANKRSREAYQILHEEYMRNERLLWWIITTPSMYMTVAAGIVMLCVNPAWLQAPWMHVKLAFVLGLIGYHFVCQRIMYKLRDETNGWTSTQLRLWNELATVLMFAIVFLVVLKNAIGWVFGVLGLILLSVILMVAVKWYKKIRER